jgi:hypothetical protein
VTDFAFCHANVAHITPINAHTIPTLMYPFIMAQWLERRARKNKVPGSRPTLMYAFKQTL